MVLFKNKKNTSRTRAARKAANSARLHKPRARVLTLRPTTATGKIMLGVIAMAFIVVVVAVVCAFLFTTERMVKARLDGIARDYYENYFYEKMVSSDKYAEIDDMDAAMAKYVETGFARVELRQMVLGNAKTSEGDVDYVLRHCDENTTAVVFYPESPYGRESYHMEFTYDCDF